MLKKYVCMQDSQRALRHCKAALPETISAGLQELQERWAAFLCIPK